MANETLGASFSIDVTDLKAGLAQANRMIRESESEFKAAAAGMDDWRESQEGLTAKIKSLNEITELQRKKVAALENEYDTLIASGIDPTSKAAVELRTKINNETAALKKNETELKEQKKALADMGDAAEDAADSLDETADAADNAGDKLQGLKAAGGIAMKAIAAVGAACVAAVGAFFGLAEGTREARNSMAKLETAFETAGHSAESAEKTFVELYGILGDEDTATEAAQQLAKISKNEKDLSKNTRILTGVMAEYGDSIPTEGLAEGMAATAAMGKVQGVLADALEWQGVNLDEYNAKLATLATEEERTAYIQSTLIDLYGESADAYRENNAAVIEAQEAQAGLNNALNELGAIAEPIMTTLKNLATDLLTSITPFVALMGEGLRGALEGTEGAANTLAEGLGGLLTTAVSKLGEMLPFLIETVIALIPKLLDEISAQAPAILQMISGLILKLAESLETELPNILVTIMELITLITEEAAALAPKLIPIIIRTILTLVETLLDNIDMLVDSGIQLLMGIVDGLVESIPILIDKIPIIIDKLVSAIFRNLPKIISAGIQIIIKLAVGIVKAVPQLLSKIPQIGKSVLNGLKDAFKGISEIGKGLVEGLWNGIKDMGSWIVEKVKGFGADVLDGLKSFFKINSPSKRMADEVGKNLALGIGKGFEENIADVNKQITGAMNFDGGGIGVVGNVGTRAGGVVVYQTNNYSQAHSRVELYKTRQATAAAVRLAIQGA